MVTTSLILVERILFWLYILPTDAADGTWLNETTFYWWKQLALKHIQNMGLSIK